LKRYLYGLALSALLTATPALASVSVHTSAGSTTATAAGVDASYPQCGKSLPGAAFGIVGVNHGTAANYNDCLDAQWRWASSLLGTALQPGASLYVNTGNPGDVLAQYTVTTWPENVSDPADPYGDCAGHYTDNQACAWEYGATRAKASADYAASRGVDALALAGMSWWLDVETSNSWTSDAAKNRAALEGFVYGLKQASPQGKVGLYSTSAQWSGIAGTVPAGTPLYALNEWRPGASTLKQAQSNCSLAPFTGGGRVTLTQYGSTLDYDYRCNVAAL
jgi:hypothetical protein